MIAPEVMPEPINPPRIQPSASLETFGGGQGLEAIGQQEQNITRAGGEIAAFEKIRADQTAVEEAIGNKLSPALTQILHDPQNGAMARIQRATSIDDIHKIHDDVLKQYDTTAKEIASKLSGPAQIGVYNKHAYSFGDSLNRTLMVAGDQKFKELDNKSFLSFIDNTTAQDALMWSQHTDPNYLKARTDLLNDHINQYAFRNGLGKDQKEELTSKVFSNYHAAIIDRMLADSQKDSDYDQATKYFNEHKDQIANLDVRGNVEKMLDAIPKQKKAMEKQANEDRYTANDRQVILNIGSSNYSVNEAFRQYQNDEIDESTYKWARSQLLSPNFQTQKMMASDPDTYNSIREMQLQGGSPREIQDKIKEGITEKKLMPNEIDYLTKLTQNIKPTERDRQIESAANYVRDSANRYFDPGSSRFGNLFGMEDKANQKRSEKTEALVKQFYEEVDSKKIKDPEEIRGAAERIFETAIRKEHPHIPAGKLPDVVLTVDGKLIKLLNGEEPSQAKPKYKITPTMAQDVEAQ